MNYGSGGKDISKPTAYSVILAEVLPGNLPGKHFQNLRNALYKN